ncbi:MAG: sulfate transporter [Solirubrobacterales bacterium]|jgi:SulP family sulfate permease|nr:sulfate transporter [Solirubrobacterales bacterium]
MAFPRGLSRPQLPGRAVLRVELLAGLVVALALIPEAISFSLIAGVDPKVGLYASFTMAVTIAIAGGRPAMISAATGAMALVIVGLVEEHGLEYLLVATILAGIIQVLLGVLRIPRLMRFVPRSVMTGFVNALAILIFLAQVPYIREGGGSGALLVLAGLAIIYLLPRLLPAVPSPLVAIVVLTGFVLTVGIDLPNVGDEGELPSTIPLLGIPSVPLTLETFTIVLPYAIALAIVGLLESLMTARLVDDITETRSDKDREARGQGIANIVTGSFGGMAGCAMIGQTMINVRVSGARTRISTFCAGAFLLALVVGLGSLVAVIPMAALVAVMVLVSVSTFDWHSIRPATLKRMPNSETLIMVVTVVGTVATGNLAIGVGLGVLTAMASFARKAGHLLDVERVLDPDGTSVLYAVTGELFFVSDQELVDAFDYANDPGRVIVDVSRARVWDASAVAALDAVEQHYARRGSKVEITGLDDHSAELHEHLSGRMAAAH